jgi:hypothetical protein
MHHCADDHLARLEKALRQKVVSDNVVLTGALLALVPPRARRRSMRKAAARVSRGFRSRPPFSNGSFAIDAQTGAGPPEGQGRNRPSSVKQVNNRARGGLMP